MRPQAVKRRLHVLIAKPLVKRLSEHRGLIQAAKQNNVLVAMEVHKRWDPIYADARNRIRNLGDFTSFASYISSDLGTRDSTPPLQIEETQETIHL